MTACALAGWMAEKTDESWVGPRAVWTAAPRADLWEVYWAVQWVGGSVATTAVSMVVWRADLTVAE